MLRAAAGNNPGGDPMLLAEGTGSPGHQDGGPPAEGSTCFGTVGRSRGGGGGIPRGLPLTAIVVTAKSTWLEP